MYKVSQIIASEFMSYVFSAQKICIPEGNCKYYLTAPSKFITSQFAYRGLPSFLPIFQDFLPYSPKIRALKQKNIFLILVERLINAVNANDP